MEMKSHAPGTFSWIDCATTDAKKAKSFYGELFGWTFEDMPAGPDMTYSMATLRGKWVAAIYEMGGEERKMVPPHWNVYATVANVDESAQKVPSLGGKIIAPPFDVLDVGRQAVIADATGAVLCLWQPKKHIGAQIVGEPGALCWTELETRDTEAAETFYAGLFGWKAKRSTDYTEWQQGGDSFGGMRKIGPEMGQVPPHWLAYVMVKDCSASTALAQKAGAKILVPAMHIEKVGRFSVLADPTGATFALYEPQSGA